MHLATPNNGKNFNQMSKDLISKGIVNKNDAVTWRKVDEISEKDLRFRQSNRTSPDHDGYLLDKTVE